MIKTVVREHKWPPEIIGGFFIDDIDYNGLEFWFNDVKEMYKKPKDKKDTDK
jgi:hypothetical protein